MGKMAQLLEWPTRDEDVRSPHFSVEQLHDYSNHIIELYELLAFVQSIYHNIYLAEILFQLLIQLVPFCF